MRGLDLMAYEGHRSRWRPCRLSNDWLRFVMAVVVKNLISAETTRDGGSLAASFRDEHDVVWILFLKLRQVFHEGQVERLGLRD